MEKLEYSQELLDMIQPGKAVRVFYNEDNINNQVCYIRAIVDDEFMVYRVWNRKDWFYHIERIYSFQLCFEKGELSVFEEE